MLKKTPIQGFVKDTATKAILNTQTYEFEQIRLRRKQNIEQQAINERIEKLEKGLSDIKNDLSKILEALSK
jgi:hypothetical protein